MMTGLMAVCSEPGETIPAKLMALDDRDYRTSVVEVRRSLQSTLAIF
jgi:hypothetical protein